MGIADPKSSYSANKLGPRKCRARARTHCTTGAEDSRAADWEVRESSAWRVEL